MSTRAFSAPTPMMPETNTMEMPPTGQVSPPSVNFWTCTTQPYRWPSIKANTTPSKPAVTKIVPGQSTPRLPVVSLVSGTTANSPMSTMMPIGRLIKKAQCQDA